MNDSSANLLLRISENENEQTLSLNGREFVFGRSQDSQVVLNDQAFSRSHFKFTVVGEKLFLSDLKSSNGTYLNDKIIKSKETPVFVGDVIYTANSDIKISIQSIEIETPYDPDNEPTQSSINLGKFNLTRTQYDEDEEAFEEEIAPESEEMSDADNENEEFSDEESENEGDFNTAILTDRIFAAANQQVSEILINANKKAEEIIKSAQLDHDIKISENEKISKTDLLSRKKIIEQEIEQYREALEAATLKAVEFDKTKKIEELELELSQRQLENERQLEAEARRKTSEFEVEYNEMRERFSHESRELAEQNHEKSLELQKQISVIESHLRLKNEEYLKLDVKLAEKIQSIEKEIDLQLKTKKKELQLLQSNFDKEQEKQQREIDATIIEKKNELTRVSKEMSETIAHKQNEINKMIAMYEDQKKLQIQMLESDLEKKKIFYEDQTTQLEKKVAATQVELSTLIENYDIKKKEEMQTISELKVKNEQLKNSVLRYQDDLKKKNEENQHLIDEIKSEIDGLTKKKNESTKEAIQLKKEADDLLLKNKELTDINISVENKTKESRNIRSELEKEAKSFIAQKEALIPEIENLKAQVNEARKKLDDISRQAVHIQKNHEKEIAGLDIVFAQKKESLDAEIRKLRDIEEKKIQNLVLQEINQINKLKEESLKMVLDLEDSITKELVNSTMTVFANTIGASKFKEIAPHYEQSIRTSLQGGVLKLLKNELNPSKSPNAKKLSSNPRVMKPVIISSLISAFIFGVIPHIYRQIEDQNDPVRLEMAARARAAAIVPKRVFTPMKVAELKPTFVDAVIYTEGFTDVYAKEEFRSELMKKGSEYLYKQWQIDEEKSIEAYAMIFSMIDLLKDKTLKVDPDNEQKDIQKMVQIEKETLKKLEKILGNEVRLEAALKFQTRYYKEFIGDTSVE